MRYVDAILCSLAILLGEWLFVGIVARGQLAGPFELFRALFSLVPLGLLAALPVSVGGALITYSSVESSARRGRLLLTVPLALLAVAVAVGVSGGRLLAGSRRPVFVVVVVAIAVAVGWLGWAPLRRLVERLVQRGTGWVVAAVGTVVVALELLNALVLPRLYPAFHAGLAVLTLWVGALASRGFSREAGRRGRLAIAGAAVVVAALASIVAPSSLRHYDNIRFVFLEKAPLLAHALRLGSLLEPPAEIGDPELGPGPGDGPRMIDLGGRDILLVSIDALRADHVGAYGYERPTTPEIDRLAAEGVLFEAAYTATPHTSYAVTSLMTGKYMRPLLVQGVGGDSVTLAAALRRYEYRTAGFYPPAVFYVDPEKFTRFDQEGLDFEYRKVEFAPAAERVKQLTRYLDELPEGRRVFAWVHLFEPHEPYEAHESHAFGDRDIDRYDGEVAAADAALGELVSAMRARRPRTVVIVTADHGEEFGDHGGRYHGTTVYDEQVRVPLIFHAPGLFAARRVIEPVSLVDLHPTILRGAGVPVSPRIRGRDLGPLLAGADEAEGFAFAETDDQTLLAQGTLRLVCARRIGACRLFDVASDPRQTQDVAAGHVEAFSRMKQAISSYVATMGRYEDAPGDSRWPRALRRGLAGDVDAAVEVAGLLDDVDVQIRRKAAEALFELRRGEAAPHLRRALQRDEDEDVRRWAAVGLTRLGEGAPLAIDLLDDADLGWRRLAALALAEAGNDRGEAVLLSWWRSAYPEDPRDAKERIPFDRAREIAAALGRIRSEAAVLPLGWGLSDVRLRSHVARALAEIGEKAARPALAKALADERYQDSRVALAEALVSLGGRYELRDPLVRFLGVPDPLPGGLALAERADILAFVGGPRERELRRLREFATSGVTIGLLVPKTKHASGEGLRVICRARSDVDGEIRFGLADHPLGDGSRQQRVPKHAMRLVPAQAVTIALPAGPEPREVHAALPPAVRERLEPGAHGDFVVYATQGIEVEVCAVVPLSEEVPPPPPEPWTAD
jgi:hypothetical protein